jgi:hypothetical protein
VRRRAVRRAGPAGPLGRRDLRRGRGRDGRPGGGDPAAWRGAGGTGSAGAQTGCCPAWAGRSAWT